MMILYKRASSEVQVSVWLHRDTSIDGNGDISMSAFARLLKNFTTGKRLGRNLKDSSKLRLALPLGDFPELFDLNFLHDFFLPFFFK